jgi:hypothetical protein
MLSTVGRFIYTKNCEIPYVEHWWRFIYTQYWEILSVDYCGKIYLHKILGNIFCWTLSEDLFTQNTGKYFMLITVGRFMYTTNREILYVEHWEYFLTQNTGMYFLLKTVGRFIYPKCWEMHFIYTKYLEILC